MHSAHAQEATLGAFMSMDFISQHAVASSLRTLCEVPPLELQCCVQQHLGMA